VAALGIPRDDGPSTRSRQFEFLRTECLSVEHQPGSGEFNPSRKDPAAEAERSLQRLGTDPSRVGQRH